MKNDKTNDSPDDTPRWLIDIPALAKMLGVGERYIRRLVQERRVPFLKLGHYIRFDVREIGPWLDEFRRPQLRPVRRPHPGV